MHVELLLPEGNVKYLEQMITFVDQETTEVQQRIRCAWSAFAKHREELTSQSYLLRLWLHQFDAVVTPTITYDAGTWPQQNTKKCSALPSAECSDSSSRQKEKTKTKERQRKDSDGKDEVAREEHSTAQKMMRMAHQAKKINLKIGLSS